MVAKSPAFEAAIADSAKLVEKPNNDELLELYGLFKIGCGEDIATAPSPGMFDMKGKAKKNAWQALVNEGITAEGAQERYIALVEKLKATYGYDANKVPEKVGSS